MLLLLTVHYQKISSLEGWNVVVVGDAKAFDGATRENLYYLSPDQQERLDVKFYSSIPKRSYAKKNLGYIFAIMHGAEWIYDIDGGVIATEATISQFDYSDYINGLQYEASKDDELSDRMFDALQYFGASSHRPRGFPLSLWKNPLLLILSFKQHRNCRECVTLCRKFRASLVQHGIFNRNPDIDKIQEILPGPVAEYKIHKFAAPITLKKGTYSPWNSLNTLFSKDAFFALFLSPMPERKFHKSLAQIIAFLDLWRCKQTSLPDCMAHSPSEAKLKAMHDLDMWCKEAHPLGLPLRTTTARYLEKIQNRNEALAQKRNTVLIIINNFPWKNNSMGLLERIYGNYFGLTIFCGKFMRNFKSSEDFPPITSSFSFVEVHEEELVEGYFLYYCLTKVAEMRLRNVKGYFVSADDLLFNFWHTINLSLAFHPFGISNVHKATSWYPTEFGTSGLERVLELVTNIYKDYPKVQAVWQKYKLGIEENYRNNNTMRYVASANGYAASDL
ncbi:hypothetical protein ANCCAN_13980 [Ancylostoma caninum]|uniref:Uncharacterized protein n=1 Tax=Ancylostoma caninum TaxID=29170 RepID=A0A368G8S1_ANCCA|nr:hypothetical protein ANCCAN_13980 [Ancylostoma caninum]